MVEMDDDISMHERGPSAWMVTFADLVILMLTFFVLLFSMTSMKTETWEAVSTAFSRTLQLDPAQPVNEQSVTPQHCLAPRSDRHEPELPGGRAGRDTGRRSTAPPRAYRNGWRSAGPCHPGRCSFHHARRPRRRVADRAGEASLAQLGGVLASLRNRVAVAGHAAPDETGQGPTAGMVGHTSGWELSMARAAAVADALDRAGLARPAEILGHGATQAGRLPPELTEDERAAFQRRVDIVIHQEADSR